MPAAQFEYDTFTAGSVGSGISGETVICTTRPVSSAYAGSSFAIQFSGVFTAGTGTTAVTFRIRESSLTGVLVATIGPLSIVAGNVVAVNVATIDSVAGEVAGLFWVLTGQQTGGTGSGGFANGYSSVTVPV